MADGVEDAGHEGARRPDRVISLERDSSVRRTRYVPLRRRLKAFLEALEGCGNVTLAREKAGLGKDRLYRARREDPEFAERWEAARAAFAEKADAEEEMERAGLDEAAMDRDGLVIRRGRGGRPQMVQRRPNMWSKAKEEAFLAGFEATASIAAGARAAGMSAKAAFDRIRDVPDFRRRVAEAKPAAYERLELALIEEGAERLAGAGGERPDPGLAFSLLKRRDGAGTGGRRGGITPRVASDEEVEAALVKRLAAFGRRVTERSQSEGWTLDEAGHWIPPGWVRAADGGGTGGGE